MPQVPANPSEVDNAGTAIGAARRRLDEIDDHIIDLLRQRREVSRKIQRIRLGAGGARQDAVRETVVVERYRSALGAPGDALAAALLAICRG